MSKQMSVEEAKKILINAEKHNLVDKSDGLLILTGDGPSFELIAQATAVLKEANEMTIQEAKRVLSNMNPSKRMMDKDNQLKIAWMVLRQTMNEEEKKLKSGEIRPNQVEALSQKDAYDVLRKHAMEERMKGKKSFFSQLFSKNGPLFHWEDSLEWQDVKFNFNGKLLLSHRIDLEYLTPDQEKQVRKGLKKHGIHFEERRASATRGIIQKGDRTFRISDKESVEKLRYRVFRWPQGRFAQPVTISYQEYIDLNHKQEQKAQNIPPSEPEKPFRWDDPACWQDVKFRQNGEMLFSHRVRLEGLTPEQEKELRDGLNKFHINFEERLAFATVDKIQKGDKTLRISDKESIEKLRSLVFKQEADKQTRPISMPLEDYYLQAAQAKQGQR